ncbi:MAG: ATP synthase F0 subunit C [Planctomycetota bacterium]|nr:ATP synthase F0 subunit C [Planctomycetota bacterium]MDI6788067.1 ATP synthase F0 subunit C [Planctomycetota bacterium]
MDIWMTALVIGLGMALTASIGAFSQSRAISGAVEAIARQPEAGGRIFTSLLLGLALIETLVLFTLFVNGVLLRTNLNDMIQAKYGKEVVESQKVSDAYEIEKKGKPEH